jgi:hypothetical protein
VVDANTPGNYTITYSATDPRGKTGTATRTVNVVETTAPVITLNGSNPLTVECGTAFVDPGATASDACAGAVPAVPSGSVDVNTPGDYTITYTATDPSGNTATATRTVTVVGPCPACLLVCPSDLTVPNDEGQCSAIVTYPDPVPGDDCVGAVTIVCVPPSGSIFPVGTTTVNCTATDADGNTATCSFTVTVEDAEPPELTVIGENPLTVRCGSAFIDPGATATDNCPVPGTSVSVVVSGTVDPGTPGSYAITYTATDGSGNIATATRTVTVVGPCPACLLVCPSDLTVPNDEGQCSAIVSYPDPAPGGDCIGPVTIVCVPPPGSIFPVGTTTVNCTATDAAGDIATCSFTVTVEDGEAPVLTCPPDVTVQCLSDVPSADFAGGSVSDNCGPSPVVTHLGDLSDGTSPIVITRTYQATDASGHSATCTQTITVVGLAGDFNGDCCVDRADLDVLMERIRARSTDLTYDLNGDGNVNIADARTLVLLFTNPGGAPCGP